MDDCHFEPESISDLERIQSRTIQRHFAQQQSIFAPPVKSMTWRAIAGFLPSILTGFLVVHSLWPERDWKTMWVKGFLGIGLGLGLVSMLDFLYMLVFFTESGFLILQLLILLALGTLVFYRERNNLHFDFPQFKAGRWQVILPAVVMI